MFEHILNWKLLEGSHEFPGPDGGTCINEAAIVAAGFKYRSVGDAHDCPKCFSRPIAAYALGLNDVMPDKVRQTLLPFVVRLAGTADRPEIEEKRIEFIWVETMRRITAPLARKAQRFYAGVWEHCMTVEDLEDVSRVSGAIGIIDGHLRLAARHAGCLGGTWEERLDQIPEAAEHAYWCTVGITPIRRPRIWDAALSILDDAIKLGKHRELKTGIAVQRLESARRESASIKAHNCAAKRRANPVFANCCC
jgi:hypothetical protein